MRRIRTGNDFSFIWEIEENGQAVDLALTTGRKLVLKSAYGDVQITDYTVNGSQVSIDFDKATVCKLGRYSLVFSFVYLGRDSALDVDFVEIVGKSAMADEAEDIVMTSDLLIGLRGADAFQVWQSQSGNEGKTYDDYIAYLREPMTEAIEEGEQTAAEWAIAENARKAAELIRKEDEEDRRAAEVIREQVKEATIQATEAVNQTNADIQAEEAIRAIAENARKAAELIRKGDEEERRAAEVIRKGDEEERRAAEVIREQVKEATIQATEAVNQTNADIQAEEAIRATAETGRVSWYNSAVIWYNSAVIWYNSAVIWYNNAVISIDTALSNIATAIGLSNTATQNANTAATNANTVATNVANAEAARVWAGSEVKTNKTSDIEANKTSVDKYPTTKAVADFVNANNKKWVGVEIDPSLSSSEPAPKSTIVAFRKTELKRTGNLYYHQAGNSRIFNAFQMAIVSRATRKVAWFLDKNNPSVRADGTPSIPDWTTQNICTIVPTLYRRITILDEFTGRYEVAYDIEPFERASIFHEESAHSIGFATMDRTETKLCSVISDAARFRGGANVSANDLLPSTQIGRPATVISRINFENYAAAAGWEIGNISDRSLWHDLAAIYFANTNIQLDFTVTLTSEGYPQGGLGVGVTAWNSTRWSAMNGYYPIHKVGQGAMTVGCKVGVREMTLDKWYVSKITSLQAMSVKATGQFTAGAGWNNSYIGHTIQNIQTLAEATILNKTDDDTLILSNDIFTSTSEWFWIKGVSYSYQIPVFFGIEHLYGEIWDWVAGVNILKSPEIANGGTGLSKAYVCGDFSKRSAVITSDYKEIGLVPIGDGWVKALYPEHAICKVNVGAGSDTFMSDHVYYGSLPTTVDTVYGLLFGASALVGVAAGLRYSHSYHVPASAYAYFGVRLRAKIEK